MPRKSFTSRASTEAVETLEFEFDGVLLYAKRPKYAALLDLADVADRTPVEQVTAALDFVDQCLVADSRDYLNDRLRDPDDSLELTDLSELLQWITEEFTARPTMPPTPSRPPSRATGKRSTGRARPKASTRSRSTATEDSTSVSPSSVSA